MTQRLTLIAVWIAFMVMAGGFLAKEAASANEGPLVALVIGNEAYPAAPIEGAVSNARAVAEILRTGGFDVVYLENAKKADIAEAVHIVADKMEKGASAVVYYDGHIVQHDGRNFLVPIDFNISSEAEIRAEGFDADLLLDPLIVRRSAGSVVILDASRSNPWNRLLAGRVRGLAAQEPVQGISFVYAASPGKIAVGESFSAELIKAMKTPGLGFDAIIDRVRTAVSRATGKQQVVWESSTPPKDLIILPGEAQARPSKTPDAVEIGFWETIQNSKSPADYQIYLDSYPEGQFAANCTTPSCPAPGAEIGASAAEVRRYAQTKRDRRNARKHRAASKSSGFGPRLPCLSGGCSCTRRQISRWVRRMDLRSSARFTASKSESPSTSAAGK